MRLGFGEDWADFIEKSFSEEKVQNSINHINKFLRVENLDGLTVLDIGSSPGLHSLAAHRLGAKKIVSFDYDPNSVSTAEKLRQHAGAPSNWSVMQGSVLDEAFMQSLGKFDLVYSWGVLDHTGEMWNAIRNAMIPLSDGGLFYIALYSNEMCSNPPSHHWLDIKRRYNQATEFQKRNMEWRSVWETTIWPALRAKQNPFKIIRDYGQRGTTFWTDVRDWLGGYPMEFSGYSETMQFCKIEKGLDLVNSITGEDSTEFLFTNLEQNADWARAVEGRVESPLEDPYVSDGRNCFGSDILQLADVSDFVGFPRRSALTFCEDGEPLGLAHFPKKKIEFTGLDDLCTGLRGCILPPPIQQIRTSMAIATHTLQTGNRHACNAYARS